MHLKAHIVDYLPVCFAWMKSFYGWFIVGASSFRDHFVIDRLSTLGTGREKCFGAKREKLPSEERVHVVQYLLYVTESGILALEKAWCSIQNIQAPKIDKKCSHFYLTHSTFDELRI